MADCQCKGKTNNELMCNCQFDTITLSDNSSSTSFMNISLTTEALKVTKKDLVVKIDTMIDIRKIAVAGGTLNVNYVVERISGGNTTTLCRYNVFEQISNPYTLTPNNTVCDEPGLGCHMYQLSLIDVGSTPSLELESNCRCINVTTFQKDK
ncbi:hypothetical protein [Cytobacillus sp. IB215665]|uniref:hypothetical protein n=1 Tax=Cytobacillus sp. IB215665 TaxID=3097357 RepID=UPI002A0D3C24|nr:hypothetical protein [Cytobacillus sp. IB215665]MDX8365483.1 hypothetical protein [Cytobacillus sp. IB215665]